MRALIIGANGQDGFYLNQLLKQKGIEVKGISKSGDFLRTDITNFIQLRDVLKEWQPNYIFHLAANSTTSHQALFDNHDAITTGTINLLESVKEVSPLSKIFLSGSGLQFVNHNIPIKETDSFDATSAYAVARIHSVYAARYYRTLGLSIYVGYFFNHESPRRTERHVSKMIAEAVKRISIGSLEKIAIGDLSVKKEWTFAGDIIEGVLQLMDQDIIFESVIGSGLGYSIQDYINECFNAIGKKPDNYIEQKHGFVASYKTLISNPETINSLGWKPKVNFQSFVKMMIET